MWIFAAFSLVASGCEVSTLPDLLTEGEHVRIFALDDSEVCGGNLRYMDEFVARLSDSFGLDPPTVDLYLLDMDRLAEPCLSEDVGACYRVDLRRIYSPFVPAAHELTHAVFGSSEIDPDDFLSEGLAHLFEENVLDGPEIDGVSLREVLEFEDTRENVLPNRLRGRALHFTGFLLEQYGAEAVRRLAGERISGRPRGDQSAAFVRALGDDLDAVEAKYAEFPECPPTELRRAPVECAMAPEPWKLDNVLTLIYPSVACEQDDVVGPLYGAMWTTRTFEVTEAKTYVLRAKNYAGGGGVRIGRCGSVCGDAFYHAMAAGQEYETVLREGVYYVMFLLPEDAPGAVALEVMSLAFPYATAAPVDLVQRR
jgi:hypothetical protein